MISWALKRNSDNARDAPPSDDTTQVDLPDTPAPVFAVRALKTALFGTPAPRERRTTTRTATQKSTQQNANQRPSAEKTPAKPPGILLTPGTGTTRRKRVSFGRDVKQGSGGPARTSTGGLPEEGLGKAPSLWEVDCDEDVNQSRPKTRLQQAMENSRKNNPNAGGTDTKDFASPVKEPEDAWEEVDDDSEVEGDLTTDLNEPHSRSGKYWKSYFETYHSDAKAEMEKLVKYKHLAKSYAKMKDAEALELNQKLKEEQDKVKAMEEMIARMNRQAAVTAKQKGGKCDPQLMDELEKQTELAAEYKRQVEELEALLQVGVGAAGDGSQRQRRVASPRTHRTLMETQRELRRARSQVRELEKLQEERDRLKSELRHAEQRASKLAEENRKLSGELARSASRIQDLEKQLEDSQGLYGKLKEDAKARYLEAQQVLQKKNEKISELQEELDSLKTDGGGSMRPTRSARTTSLDGKLAGPRTLESAEPESARPLKEIREIKRTKSQRRLTTVPTAELRQREKRSTESVKRPSYEDPARASSRSLREKIGAERGTKAQPTLTALTDRGNLQDSQSSLSSGRSAHSRQDRPSRPTAAGDRLSRPSTWAPTTAEGKGGLGGLAGDKRASKRSLSRESDAPPEIDLVQSHFARLGGGAGGTQEAHGTSAVWSTMNTSRTTLPADRQAAAIARLQRKKAEREMQKQLAERKKEDAGSY
ncbi:hypothetical protein VTK26DRAFT_9351 [Humicola hyalothermophila]